MGTEGSGSVYPIGAETVMPGLTPPPGQTMFAEFNLNYTANSLLNGQGQSAVPGFRLSVSGFAPKITHNWGVPLLGRNAGQLGRGSHLVRVVDPRWRQG